MKKLAYALIACSMACTSVSANSITKVSFTEDKKLSIEGTVDAGKDVLVNLYINDKNSAGTIESGLRTIDTVKSGENGKYVFTVDFENAIKTGGLFKISTSAQKENIAVYADDLEYYTEGDLQEVVDLLNGQNPDVAGILSQYKDRLSFKNKSIIKPAIENGAANLASLISGKTLTVSNILEIINKAAVINTVERSTSAETINSLLKEYESVLGLNGMSAYSGLTDKAKALMGKYLAMSNMQYTGDALFETDITKCASLCELACANGSNAVLNVLLKYPSVYDLTVYNRSGNNTTAVLTNVAVLFEQNNVKTTDDVQTVLNTYVATVNVVTPSSGGGGSNKGGITVPPVSTPNEQVPVGETSGAAFEDLDNYAWAKKSIESLVNLKILTGYSETEYAPADNVTRAQLCRMLCGIFGIEPSVTELPFVDTDKSAWYYPYLCAIYNAGIAKGVSETEFCPNASVTRQDMCLMICNALEIAGISSEIPETSAFTDYDSIAEYAKEAVKMLNHAGVVNGMEDGSFAPQNHATRAEAAVMLKALYDFIGNNS